MIKSYFPTEKPRERCLQYGPETLSLRECLAIVLGTGPKGVGCLGLATKLLQDHSGAPLSDEDFFRIFENSTSNPLQKEKGLGPAGQARLLVTLEIAKRYWQFKQQKQQDCHPETQNLKQSLRKRIPVEFRHSPTESFGLIASLSHGSLSSFISLAQGDDVSVQISTRKLLQTLIYLKAEGFWLFHNHPNNDLSPSFQDLELTKNLKVLARIIGIPLNGHWIVGWNNEIECLSE